MSFRCCGSYVLCVVIYCSHCTLRKFAPVRRGTCTPVLVTGGLSAPLTVCEWLCREPSQTWKKIQQFIRSLFTFIPATFHQGLHKYNLAMCWHFRMLWSSRSTTASELLVRWILLRTLCLINFSSIILQILMKHHGRFMVELPHVGPGYPLSIFAPLLSIHFLIFCSLLHFPPFLFSFTLLIFFYCPSHPFLPVSLPVVGTGVII